MSVSRGAGRRPKSTSLSRDTVVAAAIELLDESGEPGMTVRALAKRLQTGPGSIYWHVGDRAGLLDLACDAVLADVLHQDAVPLEGEAGEAVPTIRAIGIGLFDALDLHPWAGAHLSISTGVQSLLRVMDRIGSLLDALGVARERQFYTATAIINYILGVASQMTRNAVNVGAGTSQSDWLANRAQTWEQTDLKEYPFLRRVASDLRNHDDREQFIAGLDLILAGATITE